MYCLLFYCLLFYCLLFINAIKASPLFNLKYIGYILVISHLTFKGLCSHSNKVFFLLLAEGQLFSICRPSLVSFTNKTCHCHANTLKAWKHPKNWNILWKESFNCDSQQFHQYQQNNQLQHLKSMNTKKTIIYYSIENPGPCLWHSQKCGTVKAVHWIPFPLDNWISNSNAYTNNK